MGYKGRKVKVWLSKKTAKKMKKISKSSGVSEQDVLCVILILGLRAIDKRFARDKEVDQKNNK